VTSWTGRPITRFEDDNLLRGAGKFTADLPSPYYMRFVRSPFAAGNIESCIAPDGVTMFTATDLADVKPIQPMIRKFGYIPILQNVLARDVVRYTGEPVAAVIATSEELAEDFADSVMLDITPQKIVVTAAESLAAPPPFIHPGMDSNIVVQTALTTPGHAAAAALAVHHITTKIRSRRQSALPMETRAAHAAFDPATGRITLTCTAQMPHLMRTAIAGLLGMDEADLRVIAPDVGGGFGQKMSLAAEYVVLVWAARKLRTTIAWVEDRRENLMASFHSRDVEIEVTGAFNAEGKFLALTGDITANVGAYAPYPNTAAVEPLMSFTELPGPYDIGEYSCAARGLVTNTCVSAPYRGVARPAITLAMERLMDKAAATIGIDSAEIRRRNLVQNFPHTTPTGLVYDDASYAETMEAALTAADIPAFRIRQREALAAGRYLGLGISTFCERTGYGSAAFAARGMDIQPGWENVDMRMDETGHVTARIGASPHGQGLRTTLAQIIADTLGIAPAEVRVIHGDTDDTPYGWGTFASRSLVISGGASLIAARKIRSKIIDDAAEMLEAAAADIEVSDGVARITGTDRQIPIASIAAAKNGFADEGFYDPLGTFSNATHIAIVEVDPGTCKTRIEKFIVAEDAGRLINPMIVDGQIHGGVAQGIANALLEEIIYDETGNILTISLGDFLAPTAHEIPPIRILHRETISDATITGAKGIGEGGTIGAPAAVLNAINDALKPLNAEINEMPATPARIFAALRAAQ
jgi:carbon-monoxide dehydrogenase large subunit